MWKGVVRRVWKGVIRRRGLGHEQARAVERGRDVLEREARLELEKDEERDGRGNHVAVQGPLGKVGDVRDVVKLEVAHNS